MANTDGIEILTVCITPTFRYEPKDFQYQEMLPVNQDKEMQAIFILRSACHPACFDSSSTAGQGLEQVKETKDSGS